MPARLHDARSVADFGTKPRTHVAANVERLRQHRGYTLEDLARTSGLRMELLAQIESDQHTPVIDEVWALARTLGVPFGALLRPESPTLRRDRSGVLVSRPMLPSVPGPRGTELFELTLSARGSKSVCPRSPGSVDSLLVTAGAVTVEVGDAHHCLKAGESIEFRSDVERRYTNFADRSATMYVVVTRPAPQG